MQVSYTITFGIVAIDDKYYKVVVWKEDLTYLLHEIIRARE
jgi:hypothetical protein